MKYPIALFIGIILPAPLAGISMVYNFRIAQVTKEPVLETPNTRCHRIIALLFDQYYKKHTGERQNYAGGLASYIFDFSQWFFRVDGAVAHIMQKSCTTHFSGTTTDDILFTLGRNSIINKRTTITASGLFGVPTHKIHALQHADFGYGQVGTGVQLDGLYAITHHNDFAWGTRYLYFIPRTAQDAACKKYKYSLGNVADILVASKNNWGPQGLELGYTARFNFGSKVCPYIADLTKKTNYIRSNFYAVYKYRFMIRNVPNRFLFNIAYGFDHTPKKYGNKYIITLWASWNINF